MKIGTVTLHLPFNYGNALQMFSLHRYLLEHGYDAEVLSHWYCENRDEVLFHHHSMRNIRGVIHFLLKCLTFSGVFVQFMRERKLVRWLVRIKWTKEAGQTGKFNPNNLDCDVIIAGSDQIWNPIHKTSDFFLLPDFPDRMKKVAYAASFGTDDFIDERIPFYKECLKNFKAVSVRESSAVNIIKQKLDANATLVCDPTLLHTKEEWCSMLGFVPKNRCNDDLVMYLVTPDYRNHWREILALAKSSKKKIHFFAFHWSQWFQMFNIRHPFASLRNSFRNIIVRFLLWKAGVRLHLSATPSEFVERIANSNGLITDSFHGMMFATIFEKPCNVTVGLHGERQQMSARLRNFTTDFGQPEIITPKADVSAMRKLSITPKLQELINSSKIWLKEAIENA